MSTVALYTFYLIFSFWLFRKIKIERESGFGFHFLFLIFLLKCVAGSVNLYIHQELFITNDISFYHQQSVLELKEASNHPMQFLINWFFDWEHMSDHLNFFQEHNMVYWSTLGTLIHTKLFTLFNVLSFGHIYVDVVLYNILFFIGQLSLYKTFYAHAPEKRNLLLITLFLIPSVLFWCSGMHKDGLVLSVIGGICWQTHQYFQTKSKFRLGYTLLLFFLLIALRYFYALCLIPPLILWYLSPYFKNNLIWFLLTYILCIGLFFLAPSWFKMDTLGMIAHRQQEFFHAKGYSDMETPVLNNTAISYIRNFPSALEHIFMRPLFHADDPIKYKIASIDTLMTLFILLASFFFLRREKSNQPFLLFSIFFSVSILLFIGYTIPNCGALVRYKAAFMAILLSSMIAMTSRNPKPKSFEEISA